MSSGRESWDSRRDGFLRGVSAVAMPFLGMPGMAVLLGEGVPSRRGTPLRGLLLVEQADGTPLPLLLSGKVGDPVTADMAHGDARGCVGLPFGWTGGGAIVRAVMSFMRDPDLVPMLSLDPELRQRISGLVDRAMPECGFSGTFRESLSLAQWFCTPPVPAAADDLFRSDAAGVRMREMARAAPFATLVAWPHAARFAESGEGDPFPGLSQARLARLSGPGWGPALLGRIPTTAFDPNGCLEAEDFRAFLAGIPLDWIPAGAEGRLDIGRAFRMARAASRPTNRPTLDLVRPSKGDWTGFLKRSMPQGRDVIDDDLMADPARDLARGLLLALFRRALGPDVDLDDAPMRTAVHGMACRLLYGGKGLPACVEVADLWHERQHRIEADRPDGVDPDLPWEIPFEAWETEVAGATFRVVPLDTGRSIAEEGASGPDRNGVPGMGHCVSSYAREARSGACHILSVRRVLPGGGYERLATTEVVLDRSGYATHLWVRQTQGRCNSVPPEPVPRVMDAWLLAASLQADTRPRPVRREEPAPADPVEEACGYDWRKDADVAKAVKAYAFLLPRGLRTLPALEAAVSAEVAAMGRTDACPATAA